MRVSWAAARFFLSPSLLPFSALLLILVMPHASPFNMPRLFQHWYVLLLQSSADYWHMSAEQLVQGLLCEIASSESAAPLLFLSALRIDLFSCRIDCLSAACFLGLASSSRRDYAHIGVLLYSFYQFLYPRWINACFCPLHLYHESAWICVKSKYKILSCTPPTVMCNVHFVGHSMSVAQLCSIQFSATWFLGYVTQIFFEVIPWEHQHVNQNMPTNNFFLNCCYSL